MNEITLENYRCFRERQTVRMAPLTLLVGENSTGKTSFLALIRALSDLSAHYRIPDFKEEPYDLGSFDEISHVRSGRGDRAKCFEVGFTVKPNKTSSRHLSHSFVFEESRTAPVPTIRRLSRGPIWLEESIRSRVPKSLIIGTTRGSWKIEFSSDPPIRFVPGDDMLLPPFYFMLNPRLSGSDLENFSATPVQGSPSIIDDDYKQVTNLAESQFTFRPERPFASAPVRSKPRRTYDPSRPTPDPEGDYVPMYLADVFSKDKRVWTKLKQRLERFGTISGLFDEISIKRLGNRASEPFQVQFRKFAGRRKGSKHNLIDVGYGVSQALPVITELLRDDAPNQFLLQQPEVHLHPRAQAALGSLFCQIARPYRQLVIETHSDYLLDRVRMEVRDGTSGLKPKDVSILFFERIGLDVKIHSLRIGKQGNIQDMPKGYRQFFMEETAKSLGL